MWVVRGVERRKYKITKKNSIEKSITDIKIKTLQRGFNNRRHPQLH